MSASLIISSKIWLISSLILIFTSGIIMFFLSSFLEKSRDFVSLAKFQMSFTINNIKSRLEHIDSKSAKIFIQQLVIDFVFMVGIFGLFLYISAGVYSKLDSTGLSSFLFPYIYGISILYLVFDFLEGVSSILILKNHICQKKLKKNENNNCPKLKLEFLGPAMTIFFYLKWVSVGLILFCWCELNLF